jgi:DNA-binding MarR family transcriptional regulator
VEENMAEETRFAVALVRLSQVVQSVLADVMRRHELTPQQMQLVGMLDRGPVGMAELSRLLHLRKSSLTGLVDRAERSGLVSRVRDAGDRRACRVALTDEGTRLAVLSYTDVLGRLSAMTGSLAPAERERLASVIDHILAVALSEDLAKS